MNNDDYRYQYCPNLSKEECDTIDEINKTGRVEVEIGSYISENTRIDYENAVHLVSDALYRLLNHYYPEKYPTE